jgi:hypothetical protein
MPTAVIGNSHIKALRYAPNTLETNPLDAQRFYFIRDGWRTETVQQGENSRLRLLANPVEEGYPGPGILIDEYDTLVISAAGWWAARNRLVQADDPPAHPLGCMACADWGYAPARVPPGVRLASIAVFRATVEEWIREQAITRMVQHLATVSSSRIFLQPWPAPNRALKSDAAWIINRWYGDRGPEAWLGFFTAQLLALKCIVAEIGPQVVLLDYPLPDIPADGFMDGSLCDTDPFHGNQEYGALIVDQIAAHLAAQVHWL